MVEMNNVSMVYESSGTEALDNVSLSIRDGEFVFLVGPSGSGKTTLMKLITGEIRAKTGKVVVNDFDMRKIKRRKLPKVRRTLGIVFQDYRLIENMNVYDNVAFAMRVVGARRREIRQRVPYVLELVGLEGREKRMPNELSGGEQQRVAIARALVNNPRMIVADESFATVTIIMACLIIMGSVTLLSLNIDRLIKGLENRNEVVAFVEDSYTEEQAHALEPQIAAIENISSEKFVTRSEAFDTFMKSYSSDLAEGLDDQVLRDRYVIHLTDIALMEQTKSDLENIEGVAKVKAHLDYAKTFVTIRNVVSVVSLALIAMLVFVSIFIMSNTIKLATFGRREEIAIMKMVGASNGFIRLPFVVEGLVLGILGGGLGYLAEWGLYELLTKKLVGSVAGSIFAVVPFAQIALPMLIAYMAIGVFIGAFGGVNAIRNYLEV